MFATLSAAWRTVVKRLAADWLIVGAVFTSMFLATILLSAGPIYADAVTISALRQAIADASVTESHLIAEVKVSPELYGGIDAVARATIERSFAEMGPEISARVEADAYGLAERDEGDATELVALMYVDGIEAHASLTEGRWPTVTSEGYEAAVNGPAARALSLQPGDIVEVVNRRNANIEASVRVSGIYEVDDPTDPFWLADRLVVRGSEESASFRTLGPFVMPLESLLEGFTPLRANAAWWVLPDFEMLSVGQLDRLRDNVAALRGELDRALLAAFDTEAPGASQFTLTTGLSDLLAGMDRSLTVTRSSVLALLIQLAILAGYALVLAAGLLVDTRRIETILLRSRGSSPRQILAISVLEAMLLALPAALLGPWLAARLLTVLNSAGPLAAIGLTINPQANAESYVLAAIAAALSVMVLAWPAYRSARSFEGSAQRHRRQLSRTTAQRIGLDLALIGLAAIAFWQLQTLGPTISARIRGQFGVDPLLVIAPALGLLAGAVLALRVIPLLATTAEWLASARKSTVGALASWQVARRPIRYARSALLLIMAVGIGFFAAAYSTTWTASQRHQASYDVGADLSVTPDRGADSMSDLQLASAHTTIEGISESMPVQSLRGRLGGVGGQFLILDAAKASEVVDIRQDLAPDFDHLMNTLVQGRPSMASAGLPGQPVTLTLDLEAVEMLPGAESPGEEHPSPVPEGGFDARLSVVLQDGTRMLHRLDAGTIPVDEGVNPLDVDLTWPLGDGTSAVPAYPLSLVSIEIRSQVPQDHSRLVALTLAGMTVRDIHGDRSPVAADAGWGTWEIGASSVIGAQIRPTIRTTPSTSPGTLTALIETGVGIRVAPAYFSIRPGGTVLPETFPVIVSDTFPETNFAGVGDEVRLAPLRIDNDTAIVAGTLGGFPTIDSGLGELVIVDLATYQVMGYEPGYGLDQVDSYWLAAPGEDEPITNALLGPPFNTFAVEARQELTDSLVSDPVALGTIGALTVGFVAAAVFAAVGFAVSATVSARERLVEFALLRALGLSARQLGGWLALEQGVLVAVSLAFGTLLGVILTASILPLVTLTQDGRHAVPEVIVMYPWQAIAALELAVVVVLGVIVTVMAVLLRRIGLGSLLRLGED